MPPHPCLLEPLSEDPQLEATPDSEVSPPFAVYLPRLNLGQEASQPAPPEPTSLLPHFIYLFILFSFF